MLNDALLRAYRSERIKALRPRVLIPLLAGTGAVSAIAAAAMVTLTSSPTTGTSGPLKPLQMVTSIVCLVLMAVAATSFTNEYRYGTWRNLLIRLPNRSQLLLGKVAGQVVLAVLVAVTTCLVTGATAWAAACLRHLDTSTWASGQAWLGSVSVALRVLAALVAATVYGAAAGLLLRSAGAALSVLFVWTLVGESVLTAFAAAQGWAVSAWLPGSALTRLASDAHWAPAALSVTAWCAVFLSGGIWYLIRTTRVT
ncbi:ABC transporter permease [Streptomyces gilvosporeus]|uniref:ABC transporter permease n=1 Tax=Streptomyces gilvosporeus TaxID=553510 RepID=UPI00131DF92E|nr:ABC transporter permease [Streptomyces gilvosporeus]